MENQVKKPEVMYSFTETKSSSARVKMAVLFLVIIGLGVGTGYALAQMNSSSPTGSKVSLLPQKDSAQKGNIIGSDDTDTFKDEAEGELQEGGIEGEGQYHLVRPGGESQNVYMTSSTVDLSKLVGKKIKVWGQTQTAQTAGWLMDVGRIEVL